MLRTITRTSPSYRFSPLLFRSLATASTIPTTQKAIVVSQYGGPLEYKDVPVPQPGPNDILVNVKYSGVCHSDYHTWKGDWTLQAPLPVIPGHEGAGVVVAKGANVTNFEIGDLAGVKWINSTCQSCEFCETDHETVCPGQTISGFTVPGTFQQYTLANAVQAAKIPEGVNLAEVAPLLCAGLTVYKGLKRTGAKAGEYVAIIGAGGGLGSLGVQFAKAMGFKVVGIDSSSKKEYMKEKGVDEVVCFDEVEDLNAEVVNITQGGAHAVINVTSNKKAYDDALQFVRPTGTIVMIGIPSGDQKMEAPILHQISREIQVKGSAVGTRSDTRQVLNFFADGKIKSPVKIVGLSQVADVFAKMVKGEIFGRYVVDTTK